MFHMEQSQKPHATYMREWRKTHPLTEEQKVKDRARSYANTYKRRGKLKQEPCQECGNPHSEMHHADYSKPLEVTWLCRLCHMALYGTEVQQATAKFSLWCLQQAKKLAESQ